MSSNKQNIAKNLLLVILTIAAVLLFLDWQKKRSIITDQQTYIKHKDDTVYYWKGLAGEEHAVVEKQKISYEAAILTQGGFIDSQAKSIKVKDKQIESLRSYHVSKTGSGKAVIKEGNHNPCDTLWMPFTFSDSTITQEIVVHGDTASVKYKLDIELKHTEYWKRKNFLSHPKHYLDISSRDTSIHISNLRVVDIGYEYSPWSISAFGGVDVLNRGLCVGVGISRTIIRFKRKHK